MNKANVLEGNNEYETNDTPTPTSTQPKKDVLDRFDYHKTHLNNQPFQINYP